MNVLEVTDYLDDLLKVEDFRDSSYNGLQVGNKDDRVSKVAFAVDACLESFERAAAAEAQLMVVHHGLLWPKLEPLTGMVFERIKFLIENNLALYGVHLPLDSHPEFGHNAQIVKLLGLREIEPCGDFQGQSIGFSGQLPRAVLFSDFCQIYEKINMGPLTTLAFGHKMVKSIAVISGDAALSCFEVIKKGIDVFITGEANYIAYHPAKEGKLNLIFAGHYHTEKFGLFAVAEHLQTKFGFETEFIDIPIGI